MRASPSIQRKSKIGGRPSSFPKLDPNQAPLVTMPGGLSFCLALPLALPLPLDGALPLPLPLDGSPMRDPNIVSPPYQNNRFPKVKIRNRSHFGIWQKLSRPQVPKMPNKFHYLPEKNSVLVNF